MRQLIYSLLLTILCISATQAQKLELSGSFGGFFGGFANFPYSKVQFDPDISWGAALGVVKDNNIISVEWTQSITTGKITDYLSLPSQVYNFNCNVHYIMASYKRNFVKEKFEFFFGLQVGSVGFHFSEIGTSYKSTNWLFASGVAGGASLFLTERIGIRFQGRLLLPLVFNGVGLGCGIGTGGASCGTYAAATVPIVEGDLSIGLVLRLSRQ